MTSHLWPYQFRGVTYEQNILLGADSTEIAGLLRDVFPTHSVFDNHLHGDIVKSYAVRLRDDGVELHDDSEIEMFESLAEALEELRGRIEFFISCRSRSKIFVHAGAVAIDGVGVVFPGMTYAGKTTIVRALGEKGALLYSDEFAVIDEGGRLHPFPRNLRVRTPDGRTQASVPHHQLGLKVGTDPVRIGLVVSIRYRKEGTWDVQPLTTAETMTELLVNTASAQDAPRQAMGNLARAVASARGFKGFRGEKKEAVVAIWEQALSPQG